VEKGAFLVKGNGMPRHTIQETERRGGLKAEWTIKRKRKNCSGSNREDANGGVHLEEKQTSLYHLQMGSVGKQDTGERKGYLVIQLKQAAVRGESRLRKRRGTDIPYRKEQDQPFSDHFAGKKGVNREESYITSKGGLGRKHLRPNLKYSRCLPSNMGQRPIFPQ